jgi:predicted MFS family arabinose efflux permease
MFAVALYGFAGNSGERSSRFDWRATLGIFRNRQFLLSCAVCLLFTVVWVALFIYAPLHLQTILRRTVQDAGTAMLYLMLPALIMPMIAARLVARLSIGTVLCLGFALMALGLISLYAGWSYPPDRALEALGLSLCGIGAGSLYGLVDYLALTAVPPEQSGAASGAFNVIRLLGDALAAAIPAAILLHDPQGIGRVLIVLIAFAAAGAIMTAALRLRLQ